MTNPITAIVARNRSIKSTLEQVFGRGKVTVRGSRGAAFGWVTVNVDWTPLDADQSAEMRAHCFALLHAAHIDLGSTWTDDDCQHTMTKCHLSFNAARYYRTMRHADGTMSVLTGPYGDGEWMAQAEADAIAARNADAMNDFNYVGSRHHY